MRWPAVVLLVLLVLGAGWFLRDREEPRERRAAPAVERGQAQETPPPDDARPRPSGSESEPESAERPWSDADAERAACERFLAYMRESQRIAPPRDGTERVPDLAARTLMTNPTELRAQRDPMLVGHVLWLLAVHGPAESKRRLARAFLTHYDLVDPRAATIDDAVPRLALLVKRFERSWVETLELRRLCGESLTETQLREAVVALQGLEGEGQARGEFLWYDALKIGSDPSSPALAVRASAAKRQRLERILNPDQVRMLYDQAAYDTPAYWRGRIRDH